MMTEKQLDTEIRELAGRLRLRYFRFDDKRRIGRGWPDLVLIGPRGVLFRELKTRGQYTPVARDDDLSADQRAVGRDLAAAGMDWAVWRPADLRDGRVGRELAAIAPAGTQAPPAPRLSELDAALAEDAAR